MTTPRHPLHTAVVIALAALTAALYIAAAIGAAGAN